MSLHIIIDGYNLIRQSTTLSDLDRQNIQLGREALLNMLVAYKKIKRHKITVVFDGTNAPFLFQREDKIKGVEIKFSRNGELADTVIKKMAAKEREKALVVSSDMGIVNAVASQGASTISSPMFEEKIAMAEYMSAKGVDRENKGGWIPTTKKKGPRKRLSKIKRKNRLKIKKL
ncbi:MAG: NYN domain-containing protein [Desulfobacteraceae bacterium]|nr:NYN domain-containing protein [Desulfobacteraceae bacterium]MBC2719669.1 NYN domain-containing protein [Desulfobacteraceae bacterium]